MVSGVDILGNIAGIASQRHVHQVTEAEWDLMNAVNVKGMFFLTQAEPWLLTLMTPGLPLMLALLGFSSLRHPRRLWGAVIVVVFASTPQTAR